jgi:diaminopimelate epimerase
MKEIPEIPVFYKMSGSGNDFIIIDNREGALKAEGIADTVVALCRRRFSVGADGLILIERSEKADFAWRFFNQDGTVAEMCGNGARCAARFACLNRICGSELSFETDAGIIHASVDGMRVRLEMTKPDGIYTDEEIEACGRGFLFDRINTGVPHVVIWTADLEGCQVVKWGRAIRYHEEFAPAGTNVNFVKQTEKGGLLIRTYERGVEGETLACGTGSVAAALIAVQKGFARSPVSVRTRGGELLTVYCNVSNTGDIDLFLEGDARVIYQGRLSKEAIR